MKPSAPAESKGAEPSRQDNFMFLQENEPIQEDNKLAASKGSEDGETITKQ